MSSKISLVVVESNEPVRSALVEYFSKCEDLNLLGTACDGLEGLEKINSLKPDAVILDVVLPNIDGYAVLERIINPNKNTAILVYSAFSTESFVTKAIRLGADYFMVKPCDIGMLKERLVEIISSKRSNSEKSMRDIGASINHENRAYDRGYKNKSLDERITNIFITVGIPPHIKGYNYLREAVKMAVDDPEIINSITKRLYPSIAGRFDTSASKVERAIRHAIEVAWNRGKMENVNSLFGIKIYSNNEKPTNGEFIALIADKMLLEGA